MELEITSFFNAAAPMDYSASIAEIGNDAGKATWQAACDDSAENMILDTDEKREAFREFVRDSGGWYWCEIRAWSDAELNALCIQWIAGDMREPCDMEMGAHSTDADWAEYQKQSEEGLVSGRLFKGTDGKIYFYIGS